MPEHEYEELLLLRTHLTVALLAISQLRRKHADAPQASRLTMYALDALLKIKEELADIDALLARLERREAMRDDPVRFRFPHNHEIEEPHKHS